MQQLLERLLEMSADVEAAMYSPYSHESEVSQFNKLINDVNQYLKEMK